MKTWQNKLFLIFVEAFEWSGMICKASVRGGLYFWCRMNGWTLLTNICIPGSLCGPEKKTPLLDTSLKLIQSKKFLFRCFLQYDRLYVENEIYLYNEIEQRVERMIIGKKEVEVESDWKPAALISFFAVEWDTSGAYKQDEAKNWESTGTKIFTFV